jgi:hypothetical protein
MQFCMTVPAVFAAFMRLPHERESCRRAFVKIGAR